MKEVVERVLGCVWFPENPEDVYRYPPAGFLFLGAPRTCLGLA